jgi:hypothetical protein
VLRVIWSLLAQQRTGVVLALVSSGLMAAGSFIMDRWAALYRGLSFDDVRFFFEPWRFHHAWFYALVAALGLWAASTLVCTWDSLASRIRRRITRPSAYGAPVVHLSFVLALLAHLWSGLTASSSQAMLGATEVEIDGARWRALGVKQEFWPSGMPRSVVATLERTTQGQRQELQLGYNEPITWGLGAHELLLGEADMVADGLLIRHKGELASLRPGMPAVIAGDSMSLRRYHDPQRSAMLRVPVAEIVLGGQAMMLPLDPGSQQQTAFVGMSESPRVVVHVRRNPAVPLVLLVAGLLVLGVALVGWERVRTGA